MPDDAETSSVLPDVVASVCHDLPDKKKNIRIQNIRYSETEEEEETEGETEEEYDYSSEPPSADSEQPVIRISLENGSSYPLYRKAVDPLLVLDR